MGNEQWIITLEANPQETELALLLQSLRAFNSSQMSSEVSPEDFALILREKNGSILGGIEARISWGLLEIKYFWLHEACRRSGWGGKLLRKAEDYARGQGCTGVHLDTYSFQAPQFYKKHGYEVIGIVEGYKNGVKRYYLKKKI